MRIRSATVLFALGIAVAPQALDAQEKSDALDRLATEWMGYLRSEQFDSAAARTSPVARGSMGKEQLAMIWPQIIQHFGKLEKMAPLNHIEQDGYTVVQLLGTFTDGEQMIKIEFDKDSLVAGFRVLGPPGGTEPRLRAPRVRAARPGPPAVPEDRIRWAS